MNIPKLQLKLDVGNGNKWFDDTISAVENEAVPITYQTLNTWSSKDHKTQRVQAEGVTVTTGRGVHLSQQLMCAVMGASPAAY